MGNIDVDDLKEKAEEHSENLAALMIAHTHGVFEESVIEVTSIIHRNGGQVYMDGANMNAQVGLTNPAIIGAMYVILIFIKHCYSSWRRTRYGTNRSKEHLKPFLPATPYPNRR